MGVAMAYVKTGMVPTLAMTVGMEDHTTGKEAGMAMAILVVMADALLLQQALACLWMPSGI